MAARAPEPDYKRRARPWSMTLLFSLTSSCSGRTSRSLSTIMISNIYFITAIAVIGGGLFGFDISSMSAMLVSSLSLWHPRAVC